MSIDLGGLWVALQSAGGDISCTPNTAGLNAYQLAFHVHACDIWRFTYPVDGVTKEAGPKAWSRVGVCIPCRFERGQSQLAPTDPGALQESDNLFTFDSVFFDAGVDIQAGDAAVLRVGPGAGEIFVAEGDPQKWSLFSAINVLRVLMARTPRHVTAIEGAYA